MTLRRVASLEII